MEHSGERRETVGTGDGNFTHDVDLNAANLAKRDTDL